jgi:hypothetical protein
MDKTYEIGGTTYRQRPIVLGQLGLLMPLVGNVSLDLTSTAAAIASGLTSALPRALAIVLVEEDAVSLREAMSPEIITARAEALAWAIPPEQIIEVIEDFLEINQVSSIGAKITAALAEARSKMTASNTSSTASQAETSPAETSASGESPPASPSIGSGSETSANEMNSAGS